MWQVSNKRVGTLLGLGQSSLLCISVLLHLQVSAWPAFDKWSREHLREAFGTRSVTVGDYSMAFDDFLTYSDLNSDDMPLYLFDKHFARTAPELASDYQASIRNESKFTHKLCRS